LHGNKIEEFISCESEKESKEAADIMCMENELLDSSRLSFDLLEVIYTESVPVMLEESQDSRLMSKR
jgi:hypothetical protein